jgi:argininosuccinate synthase
MTREIPSIKILLRDLSYDQGDTFNQDFAKGFIELWGLPTKVYSSVNKKCSNE